MFIPNVRFYLSQDTKITLEITFLACKHHGFEINTHFYGCHFIMLPNIQYTTCTLLSILIHDVIPLKSFDNQWISVEHLGSISTQIFCMIIYPLRNGEIFFS